MIEKIIFLDCDGVINSRFFYDCKFIEMKIFHRKSISKFLSSPKSDICFLFLRRIIKLCKKTGAHIVFSSSWRLENNRDFIYLKNILEKNSIVIEGSTPYLGSTRKNTKGKLFGRQLEIITWIKDNNFNGKWIAIDDEIYDMEEIKDNLIQTSFYDFPGGFSKRNYKEAIKKLS